MLNIAGLLSSNALLYLFVLSLVSFIGSLIAIPLILINLSPRYFDERHPRTWMKDHHPTLQTVAWGLKNLLGTILLLGGLAMLVLPGQGLITMLIGVSLVDFPGKRALERKLVSRPMVLQTINRLRHRFYRPPLSLGHADR